MGPRSRRVRPGPSGPRRTEGWGTERERRTPRAASLRSRERSRRSRRRPPQRRCGDLCEREWRYVRDRRREGRPESRRGGCLWCPRRATEGDQPMTDPLVLRRRALDVGIRGVGLFTALMVGAFGLYTATLPDVEVGWALLFA